LIVRTGSSGTKTLANRSTNSVIYKGVITANDNLTILAANGGGRLTVDAAGSTIANGKTVSFTNTGGIRERHDQQRHLGRARQHLLHFQHQMGF
jgi:hypothetical protein